MDYHPESPLDEIPTRISCISGYSGQWGFRAPRNGIPTRLLFMLIRSRVLYIGLSLYPQKNLQSVFLINFCFFACVMWIIFYTVKKWLLHIGMLYYIKRPQDPIIFAKFLTWPMFKMNFSEFFGLLTSKNSVTGSILRLYAWYYLKAEKISNQNIHEPLYF